MNIIVTLELEPQLFTTRTGASVLSGHTCVVWLNGKSGCVTVDACKHFGELGRSIIREYVFIFDDMLTTGSHFKAIQELLLKKFPEKKYMGFLLPDAQ